MAYQSQTPWLEHDIIKAQKLTNAVIGILRQELVTPSLFRRENIDIFKGAEGDTITQRFPGHLPWRKYNFRNDRANPIVFDVLTQATATITVGDRIYSATRLTDEQRDFDDLSIETLAPVLAEAVVTGIASEASDALNAQTYEVTIGGVEADLRGAILEARRVLNALKVPVQQRYLAVGSDFEIALLEDPKIVLAQNVGDQRASAALAEATLGRLGGFNVVLDQSLNPTEAIAFQGDSFALYTGAPSVPRGIVGATRSYEGYNLRLLRDVEMERYGERAAVDTWLGIAPIKEKLLTYDAATSLYTLTEDEYFVRAAKLTLTGTSTYPANAGPVDVFSGGLVNTTRAWAPPTP